MVIPHHVLGYWSLLTLEHVLALSVHDTCACTRWTTSSIARTPAAPTHNHTTGSCEPQQPSGPKGIGSGQLATVAEPQATHMYHGRTAQGHVDSIARIARLTAVKKGLLDGDSSSRTWILVAAHPYLKPRTCIMDGQRKDMFKGEQRPISKYVMRNHHLTLALSVHDTCAWLEVLRP
jgi:hypothetical protein